MNVVLWSCAVITVIWILLEITMKKVSPKLAEQKDEISNGLADARQELNEAIAEYNKTQADAWAEVEHAMNLYNDKVQEAAQKAGEIAAEVENQLDLEDEEYLNSDRGCQFTSWAEAWRQAEEDLESAEVTQECIGGPPEELSEIDEDEQNTWDEVPGSPDEV